MSDLLFPIISMVLLVLAEAGVLQFTGRQKVDWLDVIFNINSGHMMLWLFRCLEVLCYGLVVNHFSLGLFDNAPVILLWLFTILAWDFGFLLAASLASRNAPAVGGTCGASSGGTLQPVIRRAELVVLLVNLNPVFLCCWRCLVCRCRSFWRFLLFTIVGNFFNQ